MRAHSAEFRREVIKVTNGVWVAVGFSNANSVLIEGEGGSIVVDTTSDAEDARAVKAEFAKLSTAPVRAIIYTHSHPDHTGGGGVFAGNDHPEILAHRLFVDRVPDVGRNGRDGGDQFGSTLPDALFINAGTGMQFGRRPAPSAYVPPTRTFSEDRLELTIAGVRLQLLHTPGETRENVAVWLPDRRVLLPGDDFYKSFPTLYAIRGARLRPIDQWIASLGLMVDLGADYLVPGHTRPVLGSANVRAALTTYRDGIKSMLDQTLEGMKKGERPDELVQHVTLPRRAGRQPVPAGILRNRGLVGARHLRRLRRMVRWQPDEALPAARKGPGGPSHRAGRRPRTGAVAGASRRGRQGLPVGRRADRLRAGDRRRKRRGEAAEGGGAERTRRAADQRDRAELLPVRRAVSAARHAPPAEAHGDVLC